MNEKDKRKIESNIEKIARAAQDLITRNVEGGYSNLDTRTSIEIGRNYVAGKYTCDGKTYEITIKEKTE